MKNNTRLASLVLSFVGIIIVIDTALQQFFNIGTEQKNLTIVYCIVFILLSIMLPKLLNKKYALIPLYIMILQMIYSLFLIYI
jgi:hypothetical protein